MTDPLAVGTGDRVISPDVLMAADTGLKYLVHEQVAVPSLLARGGEHRRVVSSAPREGRHPQAARHEPGGGVTSMDRRSALREKLLNLRDSRLVLLGILVAPLVIAGYVGLTVLLFLPLLALRRIFTRGSTSSVHRWDGNTPLDSDVGNVWEAATRRP